MMTGFVAAMLVIAGLVPTAYNTTAGFTLQHLHQEQAQLRQQMSKLDASEGELVSLDRLQRLAKTLKMSDPEPQQVKTLDRKTSNTEARNAIPLDESEMAAR